MSSTENWRERIHGLSIVEDFFVVPSCFVCARRPPADDIPDLVSGMSQEEISAELGMEDEDEIASELLCFYCGCFLSIDEGIYLDHLSAESVLDLDAPNTARGRRIREKMRAFLRIRDRRTCKICEKPLKQEECTAHHVVAHSKGGPTSPENLVVACRECQQKVGDREIPRVRITNTEFVRELSAGEMEQIAQLTYTEEELEEHLDRLVEQMQRWRDS